MEIKAKAKYLRNAPRKVRLVADLIRGLDIKEAETQLKFLNKRAAEPVLKLLNSAFANAKNTYNLEKDSLFIKSIMVHEGPPFKRWKPVSRGRAFEVLKRTSHIDLILGVKEGVKIEKKKQEKKVVEPVKIEEKKKQVIEKAPKEIKQHKKSKSLAKKIFRRKSF
ncbi:50S ribosomal protein L22 [Patescibacteria group bacterium]|nr:50S ribosomal protein L22 [Patescibacteria group bacterium]